MTYRTTVSSSSYLGMLLEVVEQRGLARPDIPLDRDGQGSARGSGQDLLQGGQGVQEEGGGGGQAGDQGDQEAQQGERRHHDGPLGCRVSAVMIPDQLSQFQN